MLNAKKTTGIILATVAVLLLAGSILAGYFIHEATENRRLDAESVVLRDNLTVEFGSSAKVSDFLSSLNGELVDDFTIETNQLGTQTVSFEYINIKHKKRHYEFAINVVDTTAPMIYGRSSYAVDLGSEIDLTDLILSGDNVDDHPHREVRGTYNLHKTGNYPLEYIISDMSGNQATHQFTLQVVKPTPSDNQNPSPASSTNLSDIIHNHKTTQTKIGIDVSKWQGEIDWPAVKAAGVEFAFIRVGYQYEYDGEYVLDPYFQTNLAAANAINLPVGAYFYSYAHTPEQAAQQAQWVIEQLQPYQAELGVAFDWESWSEFNQAGMSFYTINQAARNFIQTVETAGYPGLLYSSKNYLERIWEPASLQVWLAQYYDYPTYDGEFSIWQLSNTGRVPGIDGDVDLNIMYLDHE